ncbi:MAG: Proline racemase, partial [Chloroflexota bacterium]|nr:Proline racemase [Chloroflexota bacterium]
MKPTSAAALPPLRLGPTIRAVDLHAGGEPGRVIVGGIDGVPGGSM